MDLKQRITQLTAEAGALRTGFARCTPVAREAVDYYEEWLAEGRHAEMGYMANHAAIRRNPALLLEGAEAKTVVMCAFPYFTPEPEVPTDVRFALYARGTDYHEVLRQRLQTVVDELQRHGHTARVCIDSAPLRERYWAVQSGIGFIGLNNQLIIPGEGSYVFLAGIVTSAEIAPDAPCTLHCRECRACLRACPGKALSVKEVAASTPSGLRPVPVGLDARRCHSYLTIEHRGPLPEGIALGSNVYGCDICQRVCPHNRAARPTPIAEFHPRPEVLALTRTSILALTQERFSAIFTHSAVKRTKLAGLQRNAANGEGGRP